MIYDFKHLTPSQRAIFESDQVSLIKEYNDLSDLILSDLPDRIEYLLSNAVSRNVFFSSFLEGLKCLDYLNKQKIDSDTTIVVYNRGLYKVLRSKYKDAKIVLKSNGEHKAIKSILRWIVTAWLFCHHFLSKSSQRRSLLINTPGAILVDSYLHENSIKKEEYIDRYFCNMLDYVDNKEKIFYLLLFLPQSSAKKARTIADGSDNKIVYFFDFLKAIDYIRALLMPLRRIKLKKEYTFKGYDINPLIKANSFNDGSYFMYGYLYYCFFKRAHEFGCDIKNVLDWFENQSYDKGLYYGLNKYFPKATVKAYVGFITNPEQTPHNIPTEMEYKRGIAPYNIYLCNKWLTKIYSENALYAQCKPAAFFRSQNIWSLKRSRESINEFVVIVPLSLNNDESVFKVKKMKEIINVSGIRFLLKPHPDTSKSFTNGLIAGYEESIKVVFGSIYDYLTDVDAMIATNSTTIYEAVALGVPIISLIDESGIFTTPKPKGIDSSMWYVVNNNGDFLQVVNEIKSKGNDYFAQKGLIMKEMFFEPVTKESVIELLSLNE